MNKPTLVCITLSVVAFFLYSIFGFVKEIAEKYIFAILTTANTDYSEVDFILNTSPYQNLFIAVGSICAILALITLIYEVIKTKSKNT